MYFFSQMSRFLEFVFKRQFWQHFFVRYSAFILKSDKHHTSYSFWIRESAILMHLRKKNELKNESENKQFNLEYTLKIYLLDNYMNSLWKLLYISWNESFCLKCFILNRINENRNDIWIFSAHWQASFL